MFATGLDVLVAPWHFFHVHQQAYLEMEAKAWRKAIKLTLIISGWIRFEYFEFKPRLDTLSKAFKEVDFETHFKGLWNRYSPSRKRKRPDLTILVEWPPEREADKLDVDILRFPPDRLDAYEKQHKGWMTPYWGWKIQAEIDGYEIEDD